MHYECKHKSRSRVSLLRLREHWALWSVLKAVCVVKAQKNVEKGIIQIPWKKDGSILMKVDEAVQTQDTRLLGRCQLDKWQRCILPCEGHKNLR